MAGNMRLTVPLNALRAFEAAARHLSIKEAAAEIGVTPSAVSHQLRILEDMLGVELMRRTGPRLELTEAGRALSPDLTAGFSRIVSAVGGLTAERRVGPLRLSMLPTFAVHWLSPRLAAYPFARTGFELLITTSQAVVDLNAGVADAAVRHGAGTWPGVVSDLLFEETVGLLGRPQLRGGNNDLRSVIGRSNLFLSEHRRAHFEQWNATLPGGPVSPAAITMVDSVGLGLQAAIDGAGVTLAGAEIVECDLATGRLALLFDHRIAAGAGYYLVYPEALARDRRVRNLRAWLLAQVERAGDPCACH
ncbi:LysR substrate-binding domain-containing protein [Aquabacter sp. L1I39]|uniref:LysR substrate-binding domain-containing protein n=1 Tax=Aquabacter sp. L1I39 TaxID=2820278 RepID=UPI001FFD4DF0|nr:LysR substrate-binding domain-containing protein [Aquabacter sp. L1I39]